MRLRLADGDICYFRNGMGNKTFVVIKSISYPQAFVQELDNPERHHLVPHVKLLRPARPSASSAIMDSARKTITQQALAGYTACQKIQKKLGNCSTALEMN